MPILFKKSQMMSNLFHMFDVQLFLGFSLTKAFQLELDKLPIEVKNFFILNQPSPYLQSIENKGNLYLGKILGTTSSMQEIDSSHSHILSLLKKLIPHFPYDKHPLILIALENHQKTEEVF